MADDPMRRAPPERVTINLNESWEVDFWTKKFGVTRRTLEAAVRAAGQSARNVAKYLKDKKATRH